ncbi:MAG: PilN domain-containing protein [bacterium]|nr:PilN domain-containing protein [bacterium]
MIRINLLQARELKSRREVQQQITIACLLIIGTVAFCGWTSFEQVRALDAKRNELRQVEAQLTKLDKIVKEVATFEEQSELVLRKIDAVKTAKSSQRIPARYLDEISQRLPEQVWLVALQESGLRMRISGKSLNGHPGVADFMKNIEHSPLFGTAGLIESKSEIIDDHKVMSFTITVPLIVLEKEQAI